jgi:phosphoribosylamine--glycine ligase/phosphoribosylformylglycinamidine cyclo-ligase
LLQCDLAEVMIACVEGRLDSVQVSFKTNVFATTVVLASEGYPGSYPKGREITFDVMPDGE